jgi:AraC-like DNA-binding protein
MNSYVLKKECEELHPFPHISEFALRKISTVQIDSFNRESSECLRICYVLEGRFEWLIDDRHHILYPGDVAIILPNQSLAGEKGFLDIGALCWLHLELEQIEPNGIAAIGNWSRLTSCECRTIGRILFLNNCPVLANLNQAGPLFHNIHGEFVNQEIGYGARINQLIDELLILIARRFTRENNSTRDCPQKFMKLEQMLRENLSHQWTVEEMAALFGLGLTAFSEKVKSFTGFSPLNYLINIRIAEAIKLLKQQNLPITDIALDVGFYSSQHFATTFKKLTGYSPTEYRKKNCRVDIELSEVCMDGQY